MYTYIYIYIRIFLYTCVFKYTYIYMYMNIYIYIFTSRSWCAIICVMCMRLVTHLALKASPCRLHQNFLAEVQCLSSSLKSSVFLFAYLFYTMRCRYLYDCWVSDIPIAHSLFSWCCFNDFRLLRVLDVHEWLLFMHMADQVSSSTKRTQFLKYRWLFRWLFRWLIRLVVSTRLSDLKSDLKSHLNLTTLSFNYMSHNSWSCSWETELWDWDHTSDHSLDGLWDSLQ